jgi:hypothetical protein
MGAAASWERDMRKQLPRVLRARGSHQHSSRSGSSPSAASAAHTTLRPAACRDRATRRALTVPNACRGVLPSAGGELHAEGGAERFARLHMRRAAHDDVRTVRVPQTVPRACPHVRNQIQPGACSPAFISHHVRLRGTLRCGRRFRGVIFTVPPTPLRYVAPVSQQSSSSPPIPPIHVRRRPRY